jgi:hypothetical protein
MIARPISRGQTMHKCLRPMLLVWAVLILAAPACSRDPKPGTPAATAEGERLMRQMSDTLAKVPAFRFSTSESLDTVGPPSQRQVLRFTRTVTVRRPDTMYFELQGAAGTKLDISVYYDGRTVSLRDDVDRVWAQTTVPATLDQMLDDVAKRYSLPVPFADVVYSVPYEAFIGRNTKGGFVGRETVDGTACARLAYSDEFVDVGVWIPASGQPLPRRVTLVYKRAPGAPEARIDFTSWDLSPQVADEMFRFAPGGAMQVAFEDLTARLLSGGRVPGSAPTGQAGAGGATPR